MYRCATCGAEHAERPTCFIFPFPFVVARLSDEERAARVELSDEQCILDGQHFFLRANLDLPVEGWDEPLRSGRSRDAAAMHPARAS